MRFFKNVVRRAVLAATLTLCVSSQVPAADVSAQIDEDTGAIVVAGLTETQRQTLRSDTSRIMLQVADLQARRGMPVKASTDATTLVITPRFGLSAGVIYDLRLDLDGASKSLSVMLPAGDDPVPHLSGFAPSQAVIPANTLRLYLTFSEPMARGAVRKAVTLVRSDGTIVPSPFLTLGPELWDATQTRLTLLFDPGRIKQGVGPNLSHGAPLVEGESYQLVVSAEMKSAKAVPLAQDVRVNFRVGPAETRPIEPSHWQVQAPNPGTTTPLAIAFDRIMDSGAVRRMITLEDANGQTVPGKVESDGGGWSLTPNTPWKRGRYSIRVDPELEDVSGNAVGQAFDASAGTIGTQQSVATRHIRITD